MTDPSELTGLTADAGTDVNAITIFKNTVVRMLEKDEFDQLDCVADSLRAGKVQFAGGMWELYNLYRALAEMALHPTEEDWKTRMSHLNHWIETRPKSITARVALADVYTRWAWDARGNGYANTVSNSGWKLFEERNREALRILEDASKLSDRCPQWYLVRLDALHSLDSDPQSIRQEFDAAIKFEPGYYYYYRLYTNYILPKWGGEQGEAESFLHEQADRMGGDAGDILYFQVASQIVCGCTDDDGMNWSWPRIQKGFAALEKHSGPSPENWNLLARTANAFRDAPVADKMFTQIGEQWSEGVWVQRSYFDYGKQWAKQAAPIMQKRHDAERAAESNLKTPDGQTYSAAFAEKVRRWMQPCIAESGQPDTPFELLVKVGKEGTIEEMRGDGNPNALTACLGQKLTEMKVGKQSVLAPPPTTPPPALTAGDYWVRFDYSPEKTSAATLK